MRAFFAPWADRGQRFCVWHVPQRPPIGLAVQIHAFAEEANKCRRMTALQARAMAEEGWAVLRFDLFGCGDSDGDFADASWNEWIADVVQAVHQGQECWREFWPDRRLPQRTLLWSQRAGSLLAVAAAPCLPEPVDFLFWQPMVSGHQVLQQFLRLKLAAGLSGNAENVRSEDVRATLANGGVVEIGGYQLSGSLANGLSAARMPPHEANGSGPSTVHWIEVAAREQPRLLPANELVVGQWQQAGHQVHSRAVQGPAFWATVEAEESPLLLSATLESLRGPATHEVMGARG